MPRQPSATLFPFDSQTWSGIVSHLQLPPQQARVAQLVMSGMQDKEIADAMGVGKPTVRSHMERLFQRIGATDRVGLILKLVVLASTLTVNSPSPPTPHDS